MKTYHAILSIIISAVPVIAINHAHAGTACCLGEPHGVAKASTGIGLSAPIAANVSEDAAWNAYEFERDGIQYLQINDRNGNVRAAIGNIGDTFWTLPVGIDANRVSTPQQRLSIPNGSKRHEVYRRPNVVLAAYETANGIIWSIEAPDGTR
ncbi:MAG: hypothetical protein ABN502_17970 [Gammaproteobacteria bacterium]